MRAEGGGNSPEDGVGERGEVDRHCIGFWRWTADLFGQGVWCCQGVLSCHGLRGLGLGDGPVELLRAVRGIDLVEIANVDRCCGFGGTFAVKNAEVSSAMLSEKVTAVLNTRAEMCTACDNSCLMHINGALHRQRTGVRTAHLAEILASERAR